MEGNSYILYQLPLADQDKFRDVTNPIITRYVAVWQSTLDDLRFREVDEDELICELIWERFNEATIEHYAGHSLSVSDVVVIQRPNEKRKAFIVKAIGFDDITNSFWKAD